MRLTIDRSAIGRIILGVGALMVLPSVKADAQCVVGWEWSENSKGQNPCEIAGVLDTVCRGQYVFWDELPSGSMYQTPQRDDPVKKNCDCNTIFYSLVVACSLCQINSPRNPLTWVFWSQYCDRVYVSQYPFQIPHNTSIPHWAYVDWSNDTFDATVAKAAGRDPEATPLPSVVSGNNSGGSKSDVGVIVGGVVGCLLGLAGLGVLAFFLLRRERRENPNVTPAPGPNPLPPDPVMAVADYEQPKLYNPTDPTTLPKRMSDSDLSRTAVVSEWGPSPSHPFQLGRHSGALGV